MPIPDSGCDKPKPVFDSDEIATQYNQNLRFGPGNKISILNTNTWAKILFWFRWSTLVLFDPWANMCGSLAQSKELQGTQICK